MPVKLEHIHNPSDADWRDLEKLHQETAAQQGLVHNNEQLRQALAQGSWLLAGRFNDRIVGVMLATPQTDEHQIELSQAAVRRLTQRRGVMHQLLHHTQVWARTTGKTLLIKDLPEHLNPALEKRQFITENNVYRHN